MYLNIRKTIENYFTKGFYLSTYKSGEAECRAVIDRKLAAHTHIQPHHHHTNYTSER